MGTTLPMFAEETVDLRSITEMFRGEEFTNVTGRVVLHAIPSPADQAGLALCGRDGASLTSIPRPWDDGYLTHLPRCGGCAVAVVDGSGLDWTGAVDVPPPGSPATGVDIRPSHGSEREIAGAEALRAVIAEHDLRRWMFTDLVMIDETIRGGFSHPLTLNPDLLLRRPQLALTTFLHEQLHWPTSDHPGIDAATTEVSKRWPDPPPQPAGGHDAQSTWLHLSVCALEYQSLAEVLGVAAAEAELRQHKVYGWMYERILADPGWFADFLDRHGLRVPAETPVPRRYCGEEWWTNLV